MLKNFRTYQLSVEFYHECLKVKLPSYLQDQLLRASSSVALNLAEGYGKLTRKDQRKFFHQSFGSLRECQAIFDLHPGNPQLKIKSNHLAACLHKLCKSMGP